MDFGDVKDYGEFRDIVGLEDKLEKNKFFAKLIDDPETSAKFVLWAIDALDRLARAERKHVGAKYAQLIMEKIGDKEVFFKPKHFRSGVSYDKMNDEIQHLNREYVGLRKILIILLKYHGDLTLSREQIAQTDAYDLIVRFSALSDSMKFGTQLQAAKWKTEEELAIEIDAERERPRKEQVAEYGLEQVEAWEADAKNWKDQCEALALQYFPDKTDEELSALLWATDYSYKDKSKRDILKIGAQLMKMKEKAIEQEEKP